MLYNDPFLGYWDSTINSDDLQIFKQSVERLNDCAHRNKEWKYLFDSIAKLALVLEIKFDLGLRTREAYQKNDRNTLHQLVVEDYPELIKRLRLFYSSYEKRWMKENKSNGFEVQDIRLGGLIKRVVHCRKMLKDYLQNKTGKIEELEELLDSQNQTLILKVLSVLKSKGSLNAEHKENALKNITNAPASFYHQIIHNDVINIGDLNGKFN